MISLQIKSYISDNCHGTGYKRYYGVLGINGEEYTTCGDYGYKEQAMEHLMNILHFKLLDMGKL